MPWRCQVRQAAHKKAQMHAANIWHTICQRKGALSNRLPFVIMVIVNQYLAPFYKVLAYWNAKLACAADPGRAMHLLQYNATHLLGVKAGRMMQAYLLDSHHVYH